MRNWSKCQQMQGLCCSDVLWTCAGLSSSIDCFGSYSILRQKNTHKLNHLTIPRLLTDEGLWLCLWRARVSLYSVSGLWTLTTRRLTLLTLTAGWGWDTGTGLEWFYSAQFTFPPQTSRANPLLSCLLPVITNDSHLNPWYQLGTNY